MTKRLFQIISSIWAMIFALTLSVFSILLILPFMDIQIFDLEFFNALHAGIEATTNEIGFLNDMGNGGNMLFIVITLALPAILLLMAAVLWMISSRGSKAKQVFATLFGLLGIGLFTAITEIYAETLFGENYLYWMVGIGAVCAIMLLFIILACVTKHKHKHAAEEVAASDAEAQEEAIEEEPAVVEEPEVVEPIAEVEEEPQPEVEEEPEPEPQPIVETVEPIEPEPEPQPEPEQPKPQVQDPPLWHQYFAPQPEPAPESYIPDDRKNTVDDVMENTYGGKMQNLSDKNFKKIRTLRSLVDTRTISKDEYIAVVDKYLQEEKNKKGDIKNDNKQDK